MKLAAKARFGFGGNRVVALVKSRDYAGGLIAQNLSAPRAIPIRIKATDEDFEPHPAGVLLPADMGYLAEGDIVLLNPAGAEARVLYRRNSRHNALFITERCNSRCLMCSQPPRDVEDGYLVDEILTMLPWMAKDTPELGITGGEPTLLGNRLVEVVSAAREHLPETPLHMLSNGRLLAYASFAKALGDVRHPDFMVGIPLYSDLPRVHDFVVQAKGAFEQTIMGILNLGRAGVKVEIRMVIHRETYARLPQFARFVARNLPFVDQVVLMGLEPMGFGRSNFDALWIAPADYREELEECVEVLSAAHLNVSIYNHQLCALRPTLWPFARRSISDWKNEYPIGCEPCVRKEQCGGFFVSALGGVRAAVQPIRSGF